MARGGAGKIQKSRPDPHYVYKINSS